MSTQNGPLQRSVPSIHQLLRGPSAVAVCGLHAARGALPHLRGAQRVNPRHSWGLQVVFPAPMSSEEGGDDTQQTRRDDEDDDEAGYQRLRQAMCRAVTPSGLQSCDAGAVEGHHSAVTPSGLQSCDAGAVEGHHPAVTPSGLQSCDAGAVEGHYPAVGLLSHVTYAELIRLARVEAADPVTAHVLTHVDAPEARWRKTVSGRSGAEVARSRQLVRGRRV